MKNKTLLLIICLGLGLGKESLAQTGQPASISVNASISNLEKAIPQLMKQSEVPGLSAALITDGKIVWQKPFGVINVDTKVPVTNETIFEAASLTKIVTAYAALKLVDQGKLSLDTPLNKYLGNNYDCTDPRINLITARHVLTHSAGFPNWRPDGSKTLPINFNPGEKFSYSGEGFVYLSKVMEKLTGMSFTEYINKTVLQPLDMSHSSLMWLDSYDKTGAYRHNGFGELSFRNQGDNVNAAASLRTTVGDYAKFVLAILNGRGLKLPTWTQMLTPQIQVNAVTAPALWWGLGLGMEVNDRGNSFWHWGDQGDSKCYVTADIRTKNAIIYFTNSRNGLSFVREIVTTAIGGVHPAPDWLDYAKYNPDVKKFFGAVIEKGATPATKEYREQKQKDSTRALSESTVNEIGYSLLRMKKIDEAIAIFEMNTVDFPSSSNTWDSLAEAYMTKGNKELAIKYYEISLALDPGNSNAVEQLKKLRQ